MAPYWVFVAEPGPDQLQQPQLMAGTVGARHDHCICLPLYPGDPITQEQGKSGLIRPYDLLLVWHNLWVPQQIETLFIMSLTD